MLDANSRSVKGVSRLNPNRTVFKNVAVTIRW